MQGTMRRCVLGVVVWAWAIAGCTAIPPKGASDTLPTGPFFMAEPDELGMLQAISKAQEARIKACQKGQPCEDASYLRGLVALFENRADAMSTFQGLHNTMPTSPPSIPVHNSALIHQRRVPHQPRFSLWSRLAKPRSPLHSFTR